MKLEQLIRLEMWFYQPIFLYVINGTDSFSKWPPLWGKVEAINQSKTPLK